MRFLQNTLTIRCQNSLPTRVISVHSRVEDPKMLWVRDQIRESPTDSRQKSHFPRYLQLSCKAISLANFFRTQNVKSESRGDSWPKPLRKAGSKTVESCGMNGKYNIFKIDFLKSGSWPAQNDRKVIKNQKNPQKLTIWAFSKENILTNLLLTWDQKIFFSKMSILVQSKNACEFIF